MVEATAVVMVAVVITVVVIAVVMIPIAIAEAAATIALVMKTVVIAGTARTEDMIVTIVTIEAATVVALLLVLVERIATTVDTSVVIAMRTAATAVLIGTAGLARIVSAMLPAGEMRDVALVMTEIATSALNAMLNDPVILLPLDMPNLAPEPKPVNPTLVPLNFPATKSPRPGHCC